MIPPRPPLSVVRLSDHFGQYVITIHCACGQRRQASPRTLAAIASHDALLADVIRRLRCSKCGGKKCTAPVWAETKRDG